MTATKVAAVEVIMKRLVVLAFTEKDFLSWDKPTQKQWMKDHPDSKFGEALKKGGGKGATLVPKAAEKKPKLSPDEKEKKRRQDFIASIADKTPAQKKVFTEAFKAGIRIPPAWTDASFHGVDAEDGITARGIDKKGQKQVLENAEVRAAKTVEKHARIQETLEPKFEELSKKLRSQAKRGDPSAQVLYIMTQMAFRIGGKVSGKAEHRSYGATSLLVRHASVDEKGVVTFDFQGKDNKRQLHTTKDPVIAAIIKENSKDKDGEAKLFATNEGKVRDHWQSIGGSEKPHDIRSVWATRLAKKVVDSSEAPTTKKEYQALVKRASEVASAKLGNRPSQALESYIDHSVFPEAPE